MYKIVWLTGHSGAGKTTIAKRLQKDWPCIILDGDEMRASISVSHGFERCDRADHNYRVARLARTLVSQTNVVVSVIAPIKKVRDEIQEIDWVYIKRTLPEREGHFYEVSNEYPVIDVDNMNVEECVVKLKEIIGISPKKIYELFIGRYQPLHEGHLALFDAVRKEGENIAIGVRDTEISEDNPLGLQERISTIQLAVPDAYVFAMPDIKGVCHGRKVGWGVREIRLDEETEAISATKIRNATL